jgi:hypothetical protein
MSMNLGRPAPAPTKTASYASPEPFEPLRRDLRGRVRLGLDELLRQAELRDAVDHDAAGLLEGLEDDDLVALAADVHGAGEPGGTGAYDGHPPPRGRCDAGKVACPACPLPIGDEALEPADLDGLLDRFKGLAEGAGRLALGLLRTDPPADGGEEVRGLDDARGAGEVPLPHLHDEAGNVDEDGASGHAGCVLAVEAALGLEDGLVLAVALGDLVHVAAAPLGLLAGHVLHGQGETVPRRKPAARLADPRDLF